MIQVKMTKPVRSVVILLTIAMLGITACMQSSDCSSDKVFCAALVTDTLGVQDHGMNQDTWAGLEESKTNGLVDRIEYIESVDTRDYEKNIAYFAKNGFDVIITSGVGMRDETLRSADLYPDSVFVGMNQPQAESRPNLVSITFPEDQMGFLAGALAARITKTQLVGAVCETSGIDSMWRYCEGFRAGVKFIDNHIKAQVIYNENGSSEKLFIDETWGYETGQTLIQRGVDVIFAAGGATGQGALRAAVEAQINVIGAERDQAAVLGESNSRVVTSILGSTSFEVQDVIRLLREGNISEVRSGQVRYMPLNQKFPESLSGELDVLLQQLLNGEIRSGVASEKP
ncbi:MAG: BMP family ABC transporter substrate-binding protein [Chloroflexi bacterium]|nr:BMP family ABC transporter substrate-binding protein [Chloroflexota bacterium]